MVLNARNRTFGDYTNRKAPLANNYFFAALAGYDLVPAILLLWDGGEPAWQRGQLLDPAYGVYYPGGEHLGYLRLKEWKGVSSRTRITITAGIVVILLSVMLVGYGNSLK